MSRFIRTSLSMATIGLASVQGVALADENFIVQPKLQQAAPARTDGGSKPNAVNNPNQTLVVQPAKSQQTTHSKVQPLSQTILPATPNDTASPSQTVPNVEISANEPTSLPLNVTELPQAGHSPSNAITSATSESWRDSNGLTWVKRGSVVSNKAAESTRFQNEHSWTHSDQGNRLSGQHVEPVQTLPSKTAVGPAVQSNHSVSNMIHGQATASAFSLAKASSSSTPIWLDTSPANNAAAQADQTNTKEDPASSLRAQKLHLASRVSKQILGDQAGPTKQLALNGSSLAGPAAVEQQLTSLMARSEQLCRRGMFLSAREESFSAMIQLARYLDSLSNKLHSEPCLRAARTAMREAEDFSELMSLSSLQELAGAHETPVLEGVDLSRVPPGSLAQLYYQFAETKLLEGSQQHPWFSDIFFSIGRTYQADADNRAEVGATPLRLQALVFYRAATTIRPKHALASNQLGYVLLQMDRPREAQLALVDSVDCKPDIPALQNLVEASRRLGDQRMQQWATNMINTLQRQQPPQWQQQTPEVVELDNKAFGATTPIVPVRTGKPTQTASVPGPAIR